MSGQKKNGKTDSGLPANRYTYSLSSWLAGTGKDQRPGPEEMLRWLAPAVRQLADLHRDGKVHGMISPDQVILSEKYWLCCSLPEKGMKEWGRDWGRYPGSALLTAPGPGGAVGTGAGGQARAGRQQENGTAAFRPLEQLIPAGKTGPWSDVYSLCAVLFAATSGVIPMSSQNRMYQQDDLMEWYLRQYPEKAWAKAVVKGLSLLPRDRFQDGQALYEGLYGKKTVKNVLKKDRKKKGDEKKVYFLGTEIRCEEVLSVTFLDSGDASAQKAEGKTWEVAEPGKGSVALWTRNRETGCDVYIAAEGGVTANPYSGELFRDCGNLKRVHFGSCYDTTQTVSMDCMFYNCASLEEADVERLQTGQTTNMQFMFYSCGSLKKLDVSGFDTGRVTSMRCMFSKCAALTELDVSGFHTSQVKEMDWMFGGCSALKTLDVSGFDTSRTVNMRVMFYNCGSLEKLDVSGFRTAGVTGMDYMFSGCARLKELDVSGFDTSRVTDMGWMFYGCSGLTELDVSRFSTGRVTRMRSMFNGCSNLRRLDLDRFDTGNVTDMSYMFYGCRSLEQLDISGFDLSKAADIRYMFKGTVLEQTEQ